MQVESKLQANYPGLLIAVEGSCDGVGKSTMTTRLNTALKKMGYPVVTARQPGGTPLGEALRVIFKDEKYLKSGEIISPVTEALILAASRKQLIDNIIVPNLNSGKIVIIDRHDLSTYAYQGVVPSFIKALTIEPDYTVFLDAPFEVCLSRIDNRASVCRMEAKGSGFLKEIYDRYQVGIKEPGLNGKVLHVDVEVFDSYNHDTTAWAAIQEIGTEYRLRTQALCND